MNKFGKRLKLIREEKGYTQEELAKVLGITRSRLSMYEQGKREPSFELQEAIADFFNVDLDYLLGRTDEKKIIIIQPPKFDYAKFYGETKALLIEIIKDANDKQLDKILQMFDLLSPVLKQLDDEEEGE